MEKLTNLIEDCVGSLDKLKGVKAGLEKEGKEILTQFETAFNAKVNEFCVEKSTQSVIDALAKTEESTEAKIMDPDLMIKCQDEAMDAMEGEWNADTAKLAVASYLKNGGVLESSEEEANKKLTFGELYNLASTDESFNTEVEFTVKQRQALTTEAFCGPNKSFPVINKLSAVQALEMLEKQTEETAKPIKEAIFEKSKQFGLVEKDGSFAHAPIFIDTVNDKKESLQYTPLLIETVEDAKNALENLPLLCKTYGLTDAAKTSVETFLTELVENEKSLFKTEEFIPLLQSEKELSKPIELGNEFLMAYFTRHEYKNDEQAMLAKLVGLIRKEGLTLEKLEECGKPYTVFGATVLRKLLTEAPKQTPTDEGSNATKVDPVTSPVEGKVKETSEEEDKDVEDDSNTSGLGLFMEMNTKPTNKKGRNKGDNK